METVPRLSDRTIIRDLYHDTSFKKLKKISASIIKSILMFLHVLAAWCKSLLTIVIAFFEVHLALLKNLYGPCIAFDQIMIITSFLDFNNNETAFVHLWQYITPYFPIKIYSKKKKELLTFMLWSICFSRISSWAFSCSNSELLFCSFFFSSSLAANYVSAKSNKT